uniref:Poly [ADP-ribose] polymerase 12-like n=1 Tax=Lepisosteus oculatus TaxID=7918 RepID=W5NK10_LEPOC|nr:PREDICTED: poly [ADP-ribose] polymerase 12-like isoform X1 [Lepisosteus oculatus]
MAVDVTKFLCRNRGCLLYRELKQMMPLSEEQLIEILKDSSKFVIIKGREGTIRGNNLSPDSTIIAKSSLRLCTRYPDCEKCDDLHLCKYFVCGHCFIASGKCRNSHDIHSDHNGAVLRAHFLQDLDEAELFQLLLQNDSYLLPEVCRHYNQGNEEYGSCDYKKNCCKLHVCRYYLQGNCRFGAHCWKSHSFDQNTCLTLKGWGVSEDKIGDLPDIYKNKHRIKEAEEPVSAGVFND